jgi:hypothetical protein
MKKLIRVGRYLNGCPELGLILCAKEGENIVVTTSVDTAFGVHEDGKSHTGAASTVGKGSIRHVSKRQSLVSKSSTESELIGASDEISPAIGLRNYLIEQGYKVGPVRLEQDNRSTMTLMKKGKSSSAKMRHVDIRYYFIKDRIDKGEVTLAETSTDDIVGDFLSKAVQGESFKKKRAILMNLK